MKIAITGHTKGLGKSFYDECIRRGHTVEGFSSSTGYDLRDYSRVTAMLERIKGFDFFINNAKPDYAQAQILFRLAREWDKGVIISIGTQATETPTKWTDTFLLEYLTQKIALKNAHLLLSPVCSCQLFLINPTHLGDQTDQFASAELDKLNI